MRGGAGMRTELGQIAGREGPEYLQGAAGLQVWAERGAGWRKGRGLSAGRGYRPEPHYATAGLCKL